MNDDDARALRRLVKAQKVERRLIADVLATLDEAIGKTEAALAEIELAEAIAAQTAAMDALRAEQEQANEILSEQAPSHKRLLQLIAALISGQIGKGRSG